MVMNRDAAAACGRSLWHVGHVTVSIVVITLMNHGHNVPNQTAARHDANSPSGSAHYHQRASAIDQSFIASQSQLFLDL